jgi:hypothetical protein
MDQYVPAHGFKTQSLHWIVLTAALVAGLHQVFSKYNQTFSIIILYIGNGRNYVDNPSRLI